MPVFQLPTIGDIFRARRVLDGQLPPTPLWSYPALDSTVGVHALIKHENAQPTGAFKVRGGLNLLATMAPAERERGIVAYSTGNHAQSLAYAAAQTGASCVIVMPENPNAAKAAAVRARGAELIESGETLDEARELAEKIAAERGARMVSAGNEPALIAGVATAYVELFEQEPDVDVVLVPVGGGSGAAGACLVASALAPACEVVAVQSSASPAAHDSWEAREMMRRPNRSKAEGLATGCGFELTQSVMQERLADFLLVDDATILEAQWVMLRDAHTLAEGAGAAALAALLAYPGRFAGERVAVMCTGANASEPELRRITQPAHLPA
ncbi:pyridoxal-phosphate dependent enzyme [Actinobacteria bacterium YIM 96077]|uniref:threonine ammonia-lyase n=1 Tax=Phytoactinopolyspora halophila TaxID=1981511 RepID=A0A329QTK9_9ACTN|nr:pyridoxal-phosphate dependent enzyme [Phytoactinopolyspora halophila]AYY14908.1 pyridoxal-phosphate dependent enzyme [Actinobacteria bacterium YIM 96077]RAW15366.1 threonine/serine dehydratase [Phytoactinopolyspora halophila]